MHVLDSGRPLSQSVLTRLLRQFYERKGIRAWDTTPYYVTSNSYIANSYAQMVTGFIKDVIANDQLDREEPVHILELGAGIGQFGYLFMNAF